MNHLEMILNFRFPRVQICCCEMQWIFWNIYFFWIVFIYCTKVVFLFNQKETNKNCTIHKNIHLFLVSMLYFECEMWKLSLKILNWCYEWIWWYGSKCWIEGREQMLFFHLRLAYYILKVFLFFLVWRMFGFANYFISCKRKIFKTRIQCYCLLFFHKKRF